MKREPKYRRGPYEKENKKVRRLQVLFDVNEWRELEEYATLHKRKYIDIIRTALTDYYKQNKE